MRHSYRNRISLPGKIRQTFSRYCYVPLVACLLFLIAIPSHAAISFRAADSNAITSAGSKTITYIGSGSSQGMTGCGSINPSIPAGNVDDLLIALVVTKEFHAGNSVSMTGWNTYYSAAQAGANDSSELQTYIFWRIADGSDPNTMTQTGGACNAFGGQIARFRGVDTISPFETANPGVVYQNSGNLDTGTITTTSATAMLLVAGFISDNRSVSEGAGWSEAFDFTYNDSGTEPDFGVTLNYQLQTTAGNKSISNWGLSGGGSDENLGAILALTPGSNGLTINVPAGTISADVMVAVIAWRQDTSVTVSPPPGWTSQSRIAQGSGASNIQEVFTRVATGSEPASYTWTFSGTITGAAGGIVSYSGVDTASPVDVIGGNVSPGGTSHTANSVTTTVANTRVISSHSFSSGETWTPPGGMTERVDISSVPTPNAGGISLEINDVAQATAGATGDKTATVGGNADTGVNHLLALVPAVTPTPLAEWRLDENSWNGTAGEVIDENGTYDGTARNGAQTDDTSPAVAGNPGTCGYGVFDGNNDYVEVAGLSGILNGTASLAFWINTTQTGNDTGWMAPGVTGVEEAGGADDIFWGWLDASGRIGISVGNDYSTKSATVINDGNWHHVVLTRDDGSDEYQIFIDGSLDASGSLPSGGVIGNSYTSIGRIEDTGGSPEYFDGLLDEIRVYNTVLNATDAALIFSETHTCPAAIDHYAISYPATFPGVTCDDLTVQVTAHDTGDNAVTPSSTTTITITAQSVNPNSVVWSVVDTIANPGAFTDNGNGSATYDLGITESSVQFSLRYPFEETFDIDVSDGSFTDQDGVAEDQNAQFVGSTFRITDTPVVAGPGTAVTSKIADKVSDSAGFGQQVLYIQAIQTDTNTGSCTNLFSSQTVTIQMASECENPATCEAVPMQVEDNTATFQPIGINDSSAGIPSNYADITLDFDAQSSAPLVFNYADAGRMTLHFRYDIDPTPAVEYVTGASNSFGNGFVVKPAGLCVESTDPASDCVSGDATCLIFRKAGSVNSENFFNLSVRGVTWETSGESDADFCTGSNSTTPNFELNSIDLTPNLVAPTGAGTSAGVLGVNSLDIVDADKGNNTTATQSISEVGVFSITATPPSYLGETIAASTSANIGRFIPDRFDVSMQNTPAFTNSCTGFTYQDQPFYYDDNPTSLAPVLEITALNSNGDTTNNYGGDFWRLSGGTLDRDYTDGSATAPNATLSPTTTQSGGFTLAGDTDYDGIGTFTLTAGTGGDEFIYQKGLPLSTPEGTFVADVDVSFAAAGFFDADHSPTRPVCYDSNNDFFCEAFTYNMIQGTELRWGRLLIGNAYGSELLPLTPPLTAQYFNGTIFTTNEEDNCTTYLAGDASLAEVSASDNIVPGDTSVSSPVVSTTLVNGVSVSPNHLTVDAPGAGKTGNLDLSLDLSTATGSDQEWLRFNGADPVGRVTFGTYSGPEEFIYMREPW